MGNRKHLLAAGGLVIVASVILYFVLRAIYQLPAAASAEATLIDRMFTGHFILIAFLFSLIMVFVLYSAIVFRRRPDDEEESGRYVHGHTGLEIAWTVIPVLTVLAFGAWGTVTFNDLVRPRQDEMVVKVIGQQWSWGFEYPEQEGISSPELVLPVNQPILLEMESRDVLHSFWVPEFRVKQDLVPGRVTNLRFTATETGDYTLRCAEICGQAHASMLADVRVLDQSAFNAWVAERVEKPAYAELTPEERGQIWYSSPEGGFAVCAGCHSLDGTQLAGPTWQGVFMREEQLDDGTTIVVDEAYIQESILNPNAKIVSGFVPNVMPQNYEESFAAKEAEILAAEGVEIDIVADLIAFIKTLEEVP